MEFVANDNRVFPVLQVDALGMDQKMKHLEQKLKEASDTITEKGSRLSELQLLIDDAHRPTLQTGRDPVSGHCESTEVRAEDQVAGKLAAPEDNRERKIVMLKERLDRL
jgi:hypothetical protein